MPRLHVLVIVAVPLLRDGVEVELNEGWHVVLLVELVGLMVFLYGHTI
ncbi:MAG: hypothetical protein R3B37_13770 [Nitrospira sp.]|nr:hypothetical protein [Nitrospira sp.]